MLEINELNHKPAGIDINDFSDAISVIDGNENRFVFVTGNAGTGKTTLLRYLVERDAGSCIVLAPTGIAALTAGGVTIHSFFQFPNKLLLYQDKALDYFNIPQETIEVIRAASVIYIDEISMVRADLIDALDRRLRRILKSKIPFGGKRIVAFGDLHQLPPVVVGDAETKYFSEIYDSPYFFSAAVFSEVSIRKVNLIKIFRQTDSVFIDALNRVRSGNVTDEDLELLNSRLGVNTSEEPITLTTVNYVADQLNNRRLDLLPGDCFDNDAQHSYEWNSKNFPAPSTVSVKVGAQVMAVKNSYHYVNGSIGIVEEIGEDPVKGTFILVNFKDSGRARVFKAKWESISYAIDSKTGAIKENPTAYFEQFPLRLAWAVTIHKSQGLTFDNVQIDLGKGAFANGQTYVALSRCRTLEGISLLTPIRKRDILVSEKVNQFLSDENL